MLSAQPFEAWSAESMRVVLAGSSDPSGGPTVGVLQYLLQIDKQVQAEAAAAATAKAGGAGASARGRQGDGANTQGTRAIPGQRQNPEQPHPLRVAQILFFVFFNSNWFCNKLIQNRWESLILHRLRCYSRGC